MARESVVLGRSPRSGTVKLIPFEKLFGEVKRITDAITQRAYEIFEERGKFLGREWEDWFQAEAELLHPVHLTLSESPEFLILRAEVPGFRADQLELSVEARRITIAGRRESSEEKKTEKTVSSERSSDQILRMVDLPTEVDPQKVRATLTDGILEVTLARAAAPRKIPVEQKVA